MKNNKQPNNKRAQFTKDLDKLISGDYVLVPKQPTMKWSKLVWQLVVDSSQSKSLKRWLKLHKRHLYEN
jgi:hypothetical protein